MYNFGFLFVLILSLGLVAYIVISKFPQLRSLDVKSLPTEKEFRKKQELIDKRIAEKGQKLKQKFEKYLIPLGKMWGQWQLKFRIYVGKIKRMMHHEEELKKEGKLTKIEDSRFVFDEDEPEKDVVLSEEPKDVVNDLKDDDVKAKENLTYKINSLLQEAEHNFQMKNYEKAEENFIAVIKLDQANPASYRGLADTYLALGSLEEARQTYKFVLKLEPDDDSVMVKMGEIAENQGDIEEAIEYYQKAIIVNDTLAPRFYHLAKLLHQINQDETAKESILSAVELDSNNLEYLDLLLQIAIILSNKNLAQDSYEKLRALDPENIKLDAYKEKIDVMILSS